MAVIKIYDILRKSFCNGPVVFIFVAGLSTAAFANRIILKKQIF